MSIEEEYKFPTPRGLGPAFPTIDAAATFAKKTQPLRRITLKNMKVVIEHISPTHARVYYAPMTASDHMEAAKQRLERMEARNKGHVSGPGFVKKNANPKGRV